MESLEQIKARIEAAVPGAKIEIVPNPGPANQPSLLIDNDYAPAVAQFLRDAQPLVVAEEKTLAWFALQLDDGDYGIFDVFPDNGGRFAHLAGHVPRELVKHSLSLLGSMPDLEVINVLAEKR